MVIVLRPRNEGDGLKGGILYPTISPRDPVLPDFQAKGLVQTNRCRIGSLLTPHVKLRIGPAFKRKQAHFGIGQEPHSYRLPGGSGCEVPRAINRHHFGASKHPRVCEHHSKGGSARKPRPARPGRAIASGFRVNARAVEEGLRIVDVADRKCEVSLDIVDVFYVVLNG